MVMYVGAGSRQDQASRTEGRRRRRQPRLSKGDARELALLDATEELLVSTDPGSLTVEAIAGRAKLSRSAFYFYFASKEEAIGRLGQRYLGGVLEAAGPALDPAVPLEEGVRAAIDSQVEVWERHGPVLAAVADVAGVDHTIRELWTDAVEAFVEPLRERMDGLQRERGERPSTHNRVRAETVVWMLERYYRVWASGHYDHPPKIVADTLYEVCMAMLKL
jgi:AcrR family transcriptional regulator